MDSHREREGNKSQDVGIHSRKQEPESKQFREVGGTNAGDGVPARLGGETNRAASGVRAVRDVVERMPERVRVDLRGKLENEGDHGA